MKLMYISKNNILENFGNTTKNIIKYDASASFESNDRVNTSMMVASLNNIVNNAVNDVKQNNIAEAAALSTASNVISLYDSKGKNLVIRGNEQDANAITNAQIESVQKNVSTIVNTMDTSIKKQITKVSDISNIIDNINKDNELKVQAALDKIPPVPNIPKPSAGELINNFFGSGNNNTNITKIDFESNLKKILNIDDSMQISDNNDINNELKNTVDSTNFSSCKVSADAANIIAVNNADIDNTINIANNKQKATAELNLDCVFNQSNISNISNKIVTKLSTSINNLYKGILTSPDSSKYELLHFLGGALSDKIIGAGGQIPNSYNYIDDVIYSTPPPTNTKKDITTNTNNSNDNIIYIIVSVFCIIFILLVLVFIFI
jgi:hypothetical protein